ncbi:hypothetical protein CENSYa_0269 [Cenarchaeum symbiosum A]|uniref:SAM-dependent methyltransferase n=1 Tax=Cenarchaeum symbiosum (strain A) TaxID=414004 RepID=A0RU94_CENSY|nr:hypothetical protein CENSYa_0269 [Cenarchaeum symbiosum A]
MYEAVPSDAAVLGAEPGHLEMLHRFARSSPLYESSFEEVISGERCTVYEGDINNHWLDSTKHDTSYAPFYPTWIISAYLLAKTALRMGCSGMVDVGSGDGRIAYCAAVLGMNSTGIEIDPGLVSLQEKMADSTGARFDPVIADATRYDYSAVRYESTCFAIGGLPEVGEMLAGGVMDGVSRVPRLEGSVFVLAGGRARGARHRELSGWGPLIEKHGLHVKETVILPTMWTVDQTEGTPYLFASAG